MNKYSYTSTRLNPYNYLLCYGVIEILHLNETNKFYMNLFSAIITIKKSHLTDHKKIQYQYNLFNVPIKKIIPMK